MNLLDNTPNQLSKLRTHNLFEMNNGSRRTYSTISQIKHKTSMPKINLCDYSDAYIYLVKEPKMVLDQRQMM